MPDEFNSYLITEFYYMVVSLVSMQVYDLERKQLPSSNVTDNMPTGIACPLCNTEINANADVKVKPGHIPAWCTNYGCDWRGCLRVYNEKDTA